MVLTRGAREWISALALIFTLVPILAAGPMATAGRAAYVDSFEGPTISWRPAGGDARADRVVDDRRVRQGAHGGVGCERVQLVSARTGTTFYLMHPIGSARVIGELTVTVWIRASRPGVRVLARVVLPRNRDPRTGQPITTVLIGSAASHPGQWELLRLGEIPRQLERRTRVLRAELGPQIDAREAYVDQVLLNVHCGAGPTTVWIDDLRVEGNIRPIGAQFADRGQAAGPAHADRLPEVGGGGAGAPARKVEVEGPVLLVGGRPVLPRVIEYQGEPLAVLKQLGFDMVRLSQPPTRRLLEEAEQRNMWLLSPPPNIDTLRQHGVDSRYDSVLAWYLGDSLAAPEFPTIRQWCQQIRHSDPRDARLLVGEPDSQLRAYSRQFDVLLLGRDPIGTSEELSDFATWFSRRPRLALPGTPIWARIQTEFPRQLDQQAGLLADASTMPPSGIEYEQIRRLGNVALATGCRGLFFASRSALTARDAATRQRAFALELVNLELRLIEPWTAAETTVTTMTSSQPRVTGAVLQSPNGRARLLIPIRWNWHGQYVAGPSETTRVTFVVPGIPEAWKWYALTPVDLTLLPHQRVAGGVRVTVDRCDPGTVVLITPDPRVVRDVKQQLASKRARALELMRNLAIYRSQRTGRVEQQLAARLGRDRGVDLQLAAAQTSLKLIDAYRASADHVRAYAQASHAISSLGEAERLRWQQVVRQWVAPITSPLALRYATLADDIRFADRLKQARWGANRLPAGDFEDLNEVRRVGWTHQNHRIEGIQSQVRLLPEDPHSGRFCLRLEITDRAASHGRPRLMASPPVWITSPPVRVEAGQVVRIHGWLRIPRPIADSVDGLMIIDSLGGQALAQRVGQTEGWKEFTLFRAVAQSAEMTVTFALSGVGTADIDTVTITPFDLGPDLAQPQARRTSPPSRLPAVR